MASGHRQLSDTHVGVRWAWRATDLCLFPLLFWFPLGTALFAWWWLGPREKEEYRLDRLF